MHTRLTNSSLELNHPSHVAIDLVNVRSVMLAFPLGCNTRRNVPLRALRGGRSVGYSDFGRRTQHPPAAEHAPHAAVRGGPCAVHHAFGTSTLHNTPY
jgi:hypothetical protein